MSRLPMDMISEPRITAAFSRRFPMRFSTETSALATLLRQNATAEQFAREISTDVKLDLKTRRFERHLYVARPRSSLYAASKSRLSGVGYLFNMPSQHHAINFTTSPTTNSSTFHQILDECNMDQGYFL